jgi:beta/gamma crystallin
MRHQFARCKSSLSASALLVTLCVVGVSVPTSAQSRRNAGRGITVYADPDFRGASTTIRDDTPDLRGFGLNDKISSIEVPNGESWEMCQDINYGNRCQVISGSVSDLRAMGWNDRISSLRRVGNGLRNGVRNRNGNGNGIGSRNESLLFFDRTGFRGSSTVVTSDSSDLGFVRRPAASVEVRGGTWELCDQSGRCATIRQNVSDLSQLGLGNRLRSAYLVDDRNGNGNGYGRGRRNRSNGGYWR